MKDIYERLNKEVKEYINDNKDYRLATSNNGVSIYLIDLIRNIRFDVTDNINEVKGLLDRIKSYDDLIEYVSVYWVGEIEYIN